MRNCSTFIPLLMSLLFNVKCSPISQPGYENQQYVAAQNIPTLSYKPQAVNFKPAAQAGRPVYEGRQDGLQQYSSQQKSPPSIQTPGNGPVRQLFVATNQGQRQVDPGFYDQVLKAQQQAALRRTQNQQGQQTAYQPQQVKYIQQQQQQQPQYSAKYQQQPHQQQRLTQQQQQQQQQEEEEQDDDYDPNPSYQFGFDVKDDQFTNYQTRKEEKDGNKITGSYSVVDADGYIRTVKYTADPKEGFKAEVTREPTDIKIKIPKPDAFYQSLPRQSQQHQQAVSQNQQHQQAARQNQQHQQATRQNQQHQQAARQHQQYDQGSQRRIPQQQHASDEANGNYQYQ